MNSGELKSVNGDLQCVRGDKKARVGGKGVYCQKKGWPPLQAALSR